MTETVHAAHPSGDEKVTVHTPTFTTQVSADQFEEAMKNGAEKTKDNTFVLSRLIQAIDRLTVRMPSSIKLHM